MSEAMSVDDACRAIRGSVNARRPGVLVVGSGLLRQLGFGPFADWSTLMHEIACELGVPYDEKLSRHQPTLHWEAILAKAARMHGEPAFKIEERAQRHVQSLVQVAERRLDDEAYRSLAKSTRVRSVVTLNFTAAPFVGGGDGRLVDSRVPYVELDNRVVWCPHGNARRPETIGLGVRKYVRMLRLLEDLRGSYKMALRESVRKQPPKEVAREPNFMEHVLGSPLVFAGCGLHHAEWTLWWLLANKTRNEARHATSPSIYLAGKPVDDELSSALESMNCKVVEVRGHPAVWEAVTMALKP